MRALERRSTAALRSPTARWIGFTVGLAAFALFIVTFARSGARASDALSGRSLLTMAPALIGVLVFEVAAIHTLGSVGANQRTSVWATSQLAKYLPVPASAAAGMLGSSVRAGHSPRGAFRILLYHSVLLIGAAAMVGSLAAGALPEGRGAWPPNWISAAVFGAGLAITIIVLRPLPGGRRATTGGAAVAGWAAVAVGMGSSFAPSGDVGAMLLFGSAYCAAWVAGQIVVPVPAGLGIREAALVGLLASTAGSTAALRFAVLSRLIHVLADGLLALAVFVVRPVLRADDEG